MNTRNNRAVLVIALVAASLGLAACSKSSPASTSHPAASAKPLSPSAALAATTGKLAGTSYDVTVAGDGESGTGAVDSAAKTAVLNVKTPIGGGQTLRMDTVTVDKKIYLNIDGGSVVDRSMHVDPHAWMQVDPKKLHADVAMPLDQADPANPLDLDGLLQAVTTVHRTDATHYAGTIDLTNSGGVLSPDEGDLKKAGSAAKSVPFTAVLDTQGRLLNLTIDAARPIKDLAMTLTLSHYGSASVTKPPAGAITTTPAGVYSMLNG